MTRTLVWNSLLAIAVAGCDDDGGGSSPPAPVAFEEFPVELGDAVCEAVFRCCTATERDDAGFAGADDQATCASTYGGLIASLSSLLDPSIGAGRIECDLVCVDGYYCDWDSDTCLAAKPDGSDCSSTAECTSGRCDLDASTCVVDGLLCS